MGESVNSLLHWINYAQNHTNNVHLRASVLVKVDGLTINITIIAEYYENANSSVQHQRKT